MRAASRETTLAAKPDNVPIVGLLFLLLIDTSMKLLGASLFAIYIIKGSVILAAAVVDTLRHRLLVKR